MSSITVLIPVYRAEIVLIKVVKELKIRNMNSIIIVRDGVNSDEDHIFESLRELNCLVLTHEENQGKGKALKTGLQYFYSSYSFTNQKGIVTADADGQHSADDIVKVAEAVLENPYDLVLGTRNFSKDIPFRSKIGNIITRKLFSFLVGKKVSDTQTGLRGIPRCHVQDFFSLKGDKYEYEMNMLIATRKLGIDIKEVGIETIYIENNKSSHFNPLIDSIKIYWLLLGFMLSSIACFIVDIALFWLILILLTKVQLDRSIDIGIATIIARATSIGINYNFNKKIVFSSNKSHKEAFFQYIALALFSLSVSWGVVYSLSEEFKSTVTGTLFIKVFVEGGLFLFNFYIQNKFIFINKKQCNRPPNN